MSPGGLDKHIFIDFLAELNHWRKLSFLPFLCGKLFARPLRKYVTSMVWEHSMTFQRKQQNGNLKVSNTSGYMFRDTIASKKEIIFIVLLCLACQCLVNEGDRECDIAPILPKTQIKHQKVSKKSFPGKFNILFCTWNL